MRRAFRIGSWIVLALFAMPLCLLAWLLGTAPGARTLAAWVPASVAEVGRIEGRLAGPLVLRDLRIDAGDWQVTIDLLELDWQPLELWNRILRVNSVRAESVLVERVRVSADDGEPMIPPDLTAPLAIDVRLLQVAGLIVDDGTSQRAVDRIRMRAGWRERTLKINELAARAPWLDIVVQAQAQTRPPYRLTLEAEHWVQVAGIAPISGEFSVSGDTERYVVTSVLAAPYELQGTLAVGDVLTALTLSGDIAAQVPALRAIQSEWPAYALDASARFDGPLDALRVTAAVALQDGDAAYRSEIDALVQAAGATLSSAALWLPNQQQPIDVTGSVDWSADTSASLEARWQKLIVPLNTASDVQTSGGLTFNGGPEAYRLAVDGELDYEGQIAPLTLIAEGNIDGLRVQNLDAALADARLSGQADLRWQPDIEGSGELHVTNVDPSLFWPHARGRVTSNVVFTAESDDEAWRVRLDTFDASGALNGEKLALDARAELRPDAVTITELRLSLGGLALSGDGSLGTRSDFRWNLNAPDLSLVGGLAGQSLAGALRGEGRISGALDAPNLIANVTANGVRAAGTEVDALSFNADWEMRGDQNTDVSLELNGVRAGGQAFDRVHLDVRGFLPDHAVNVEVRGHELELSAGIAAGWSDADSGAWRFRVDTLDLEYDADDDPLPPQAWSLVAAAEGVWQPDLLRIAEMCLRQHQADSQQAEAAQLCGAVEWLGDSGDSNARVSLAGLDLRIANPFLPDGLRVRGRIDGSGQWVSSGSATQARFALDGLAVAMRNAGVWRDALVFEPGTIALDDGADGIGAQVHLPVDGDGIRIDALATRTDGDWRRWPLSGEVRGGVPDLSWLAVLTDSVGTMQGGFSSRLTLAGEVGDPRIAGSAELGLSAVTVPDLGLELADVTLRLEGRERGVAITGGVQSGEGRLTLDGSANWDPANGVAAQIGVEGSDFLVADTRTVQMKADPDFALTYAGDELSVKGSVHVPFADIRVRRLPQGAVTVSADQRIVDEAREAPLPLNVNADIALTLGDDVRFDGLGLTTRIAGRMRVRERPDRPTSATGRVDLLEGRYEAYGQDLSIERGNIVFAGGPVDAPGLDFRAVRQATPEVRVGVDVRGTLQEPKLTTFSKPSMSQSDQLAYLVLGRPMNRGTEEEQSLLQQAALALGVKGGELLTSKLGDNIGVDTLSIETAPGEANAQAALVIGKYLSPKLYVSYGYGLFEPLSTLKMEYQLSKLWRFVTESSSEATGGDIEWVMER